MNLGFLLVPESLPQPNLTLLANLCRYIHRRNHIPKNNSYCRVQTSKKRINLFISSYQ